MKRERFGNWCLILMIFAATFILPLAAPAQKKGESIQPATLGGKTLEISGEKSAEAASVTDTTVDACLAVGETISFRLFLTSPSSYRNTSVPITFQSSEYIKYSHTGQNYQPTMTVTMNIGSDGLGQTESISILGKKKTPGIVQFTALSGDTQAISNYTGSLGVAQVVSLEFVRVYPGSYLPLDTNPNVGGGKRIFVDRDTPYEANYPENWAKIAVTATVEPYLPGLHVGFKVFDVDDPSDDYAPIDANGAQGGDNRQSVPTDAVSRQLLVTGEAQFVMPVSSRPGDNYKVAAYCSTHTVQTFDPLLNGVTVDGTNLKTGALLPVGTQNSSTGVFLSTEMLTVWRRLHIERDSMGAVEGNYVRGTVQGVATNGASQFLYLNVPAPLPVGRFEGGKIYLTHPSMHSFPQILSVKTNDSNRIELDGTPPTSPLGWNFIMYDDDDFNNDDGTLLNGDNGEDIPMPDMSYLQDSDDPAQNKLAPAYIRPKYDLTDSEDDDVPFFANVPLDAASNLDVESVYKFDYAQFEHDSSFWTIYVLNGYQDYETGDYDPIQEASRDGNAALGRVDEIPYIDPDTHQFISGKGAILFPEAAADYRRYVIAHHGVLNFADQPSGSVVHEIAHLFGALHTDGGIMSHGSSSQYSAVTLDKMRTILYP